LTGKLPQANFDSGKTCPSLWVVLRVIVAQYVC
jgi:hypothetical protein